MTTSLGATATPFTAIIASPATSADARATSVLAQDDRDQHKHIPTGYGAKTSFAVPELSRL